MLKKPHVIITHPKEWAQAAYAKKSRYQFTHVSIGGEIPKKRNGVPTFDGYAEVSTMEGIKSIEDAFVKIQPAIFLWWIHVGMTPRLVAKLKSLSPHTKFMMWFGNHRYVVAGNVTGVQRHLDMLLLNSKDVGQYNLYLNAGLKHVGTLWDGFAPTEVNLVEEEPKYDCCFGGETYVMDSKQNPKLRFPGGQLRYDFVTQMHKRFKSIVFSSRPSSWPFQTAAGVFHPAYTHALRQAKITTNLNHFPDLFKAYTRRTMRSLFARRCHITLYIPGMEEDFTNHKDVVWFGKGMSFKKAIKEGLDLIQYYLDHDTEREDIAWSGWNLAMKKFTFKERMRDFEKLADILMEE